MALGWLWWRAWARFSRRWRVWRRGTLRGRRGTWWHPPSFRVAGVALGHIHLRFAWQAWHFWNWAGSGGALGPLFVAGDVSRGRRGIYGTGLALVSHAIFVTHHLSHTPLCHTPSFTHHLWHTIFVTHHLSHTTLSPTIFHTQLCHTPSSTHHLAPTIFHAQLSHTTFHTQLCHTPLCHTPSLTHPLSHTIFVHYHLWHTTLSHTIFHTPCLTHPLSHTIVVTHHGSHSIFHTPSFTPNFVRHHLSHTTLSHAIFHTPSLTHTIFDTPSVTPLCHTPFFTPLQTIFHTQSFTHHFVSHHLSQHNPSHTTLSHTIFHHTIFRTQLCHTPSFATTSFATPSFTHYFVTRKGVDSSTQLKNKSRSKPLPSDTLQPVPARCELKLCGKHDATRYHQQRNLGTQSHNQFDDGQALRRYGAGLTACLLTEKNLWLLRGRCRSVERPMVSQGYTLEDNHEEDREQPESWTEHRGSKPI